MNLVNPEDLISTNRNLSLFGGENFAKLIMYVLKLNKLNKLYSQSFDEKGIDFIDSILDNIGVTFEFDQEELNRIPKTGPFISISNHPFGGIDGLILIKLLCLTRPDFKVMANFLLKKIIPLEDYFLGVNPFEKRKSAWSSIGGLKEAFSYLEKGQPIGIFPAGEVSAYNRNSKSVCDKKWEASILKFIKKAQVPVIPIYFKGSNSFMFQVLGMIHPILRTIKLPSEVFNKKNTIVKIRIGRPISVKEQESFDNISRYGRFLRAKTYYLGTSIDVHSFFKLKKTDKIKMQEISPEVHESIIKQEINSLKKYFLFKSKDYSVFCAPAAKIPNILNEIGRLREITFREIGEGTNNSIDIDEYDLYYNQLFIWDGDKSKIVGAYRVGKGKDILKEYGVKGFYLHSLFKMKKTFNPILEESLELGRSFIVKEYQRKPLPLFLLWKGIVFYLSKNPDYRYLIGPVSISNEYSDFSKGLIIRFIKKNYFDKKMYKHIKARKKFIPNNLNIDTEILLETAKEDINKIDKYICDCEITKDRLPVLLKKYISLNAKIIGFNVDPLFNNCLDGFLMLDLFDVPLNVLESLSKEFNDSNIIKRIKEKNIYN